MPSGEERPDGKKQVMASGPWVTFGTINGSNKSSIQLMDFKMRMPETRLSLGAKELGLGPKSM